MFGRGSEIARAASCRQEPAPTSHGSINADGLGSIYLSLDPSAQAEPAHHFVRGMEPDHDLARV